MDKEKYGVHAHHCCSNCGCKYCDDDCPVASGEIPAVYECWECKESEENLIQSLLYMKKEYLDEILEKVKIRRKEMNFK